MKRGLSFLVMIISLVGTGAACKKAVEKKSEGEKKTEVAPPPVDKDKASGVDPWVQPEVKKDPLKQVFFWKAEKDGKTTYLLGTMHMGVDAETRLPQIVWDKLDAAKTFAMEADLSDPSLAATIIRTSGSLQADLGEEYWKKLEKAVGPAMAGQMDKLTPMGAAAMMALKDLPKTSAMDGILHGRAMNQKKKIVFLELASLQASILTKHMGLKALKMMIDTFEAGKQQTKQMLDAYLAGDPDGILKVTEMQKTEALKHGFTKAEYDEQMEDILYKRNASWIEAIEKMHVEGDAFVAVGALHLIGPRSVLELLQKKGFKIERVVP